MAFVFLCLLPLVLSESVTTVQRLHFSQAGAQTYSIALIALYDVTHLHFDFYFGQTHTTVPNTTLDLYWTLTQNRATIFRGISFRLVAGTELRGYAGVDPCSYSWLQKANSNPNIFWHGILRTSAQASGDFNVSQTISV
eukprot:TRINITY_DN1748_c0_g1_i3.p1 TRINITY_DN1748_c0_g1~~TRINITY_DN1748_c0_g1_i3.p1  ORF type:complete len:139 (-),score=4.94 TRINITY_DN1748_c0_g1_i3:709-1125(-)